MPELPEVETIRQGLAPILEKSVIYKVEKNISTLRFPFPSNFINHLQGRQITALRRRAKYLLIDLDNNNTLIIHLGMSGSIRIHDTNDIFYHKKCHKLIPHDHVVLNIKDPVGCYKKIIYNDPRRFGFMDLCESARLNQNRFIADLGYEPIGSCLNADIVSKIFSGRKASLKSVLLNQKLIAGLGNIYVCEALWHSGLSPLRTANSITGTSIKAKKESAALATSICNVLYEAITSGGSSLRDYRRVDGTMGYFQHNFKVYGREGKICKSHGCSQNIVRILQSGRSTFYCPACQI